MPPRRTLTSSRLLRGNEIPMSAWISSGSGAGSGSDDLSGAPDEVDEELEDVVVVGVAS
jgi:hypothetical protein